MEFIRFTYRHVFKPEFGRDYFAEYESVLSQTLGGNAFEYYEPARNRMTQYIEANGSKLEEQLQKHSLDNADNYKFNLRKLALIQTADCLWTC